MKANHVLISCILTSVLTVSQGLFPSSQNQSKAQATRPYAVFVNGWQNCCAWRMNSLQERLDRMNVERVTVPYSNFSNGGRSGNTSDDSGFLQEGADFINNRLDRSRPLILIGHSFGGDSVLKLLPRINRRIQFVAVIDPVRTGGFRAPLKILNVPSNVDYFFNRWQENLPFPNDFKINGSVPCNAGKCDQDSQNIRRNSDSSPKRRECTWDEKVTFQCPSSGRIQLRVDHQGLPTDDFIQKDLGDKIQRQITVSSSTTPVISGSRLIQMGSGKCLTTPDLASDPNGANNGARVFLYDCYNASNTGYNQRWKLQQEGGFYRLIQTSSGRCLTTPDLASDPNGANNEAKVFLYDCYNASNTGYNQRWRLQQEGDFYRLIQMGSGRCVTTPDLASDPNGANNEAKVFLYDCYNASNTGYNQRWRVQD